MRKIGEYITVFLFGALSYGIIEIFNRGFTHISMGVLGGICMIVIHLLNIQRRNGGNIFILLLVSALFITSIEFFTGEILNGVLKMNIWSYSELPLNLDGQICLLFSAAWYFLSFAGICADELIREKILHISKFSAFSWLNDIKLSGQSAK